MVKGGSIVLAASDHAQRFGLPAPVNVLEKISEYIGAALVESVEIDQETADLCIRFSDSNRLDAFNYSSGYEGWNAYCLSRGAADNW
jgi:hypothetical protein